MKHARSLIPALAGALVLVPGAVLAHPGHEAAGGGLGAGLLHPLTGIDHLLALFAAGLLAQRLGSAARWLVPAGFLAAMAGGALLGAAWPGLPHVELGIALSVLLLGLAIAAGRSLPAGLAAGLAALFALLHGHAHGTEMPATASALAYGIGFLAASAAAIAAGFGSGLLAERLARAGLPAARLAGVAIAACGLVLTAGAV